jgi:hypothetical protein
MFKTQQEYSAFLFWAIEGSTIGQRMQMSPSTFDIPSYWDRLKPFAADFPSTLEEFYADPNRTPDPADPIDRIDN